MVTLDEIAEVEAELADMVADRERLSWPPIQLVPTIDDWMIAAEQHKAVLDRHIARTEQLLQELRQEANTDEGDD